jgi:hypothetical protein
MPAITIPYQPATGHLLAAYRPLILKVVATATGGGAVPPFVVCDIYIEDIYYKSMVRTSPESQDESGSTWQFDIQDALQEYLQPDLAQIDNNNILQAPHMSAKVYCRFRSSDLDSEGFTVEEETKPVQGTRFTDPVAGTGLQTNTFWVINAALQHEDNQNLVSHLNSYKQGTWSSDAFPLTHRNRYFFCPGDSDHFPFAFRGDCLSVDMKLFYRLRGETAFQEATAANVNVCTGIDYGVDVTANQVQVTLDEAVPDGHSVLVQYKKQADSVWITAGTYTTQSFSFNINGEDIAGDYDIRVIHFCTPCLSADPVTDTFTLDGEEINLAWRGINPFCVQQSLETDIYIQLETRNPATTVQNFPTDEDPANTVTETKAELWARFFTDATFVTPLDVEQAGLKISVKQIQSIVDFDGTNFYNRVLEYALTFTVDADGVEVMLSDDISTHYLNENYSPYPTISSSTETDFAYEPYPELKLIGGNTGERGFADLEEYNTDTNIPTGVTKPNDDEDPDYIEPVENETLCPSGPDVTTITYGYSLEVAKVQMNYDTVFNYYSTPVNNTSAGGYQYIRPVPKNKDITVSVKAKTLPGSGNLTGFVKARVTHNPGSGLTTATFNVPNDIETTLPGTFKNISNINISNF